MDATQTASASASGTDDKRGKTKIAFVYNDLEAAAGLASTLKSHAGTTCSTKQLAAWMNQSADGGTFRSVVGAAKAFGLVDTGQGTITLTQLGLNALDPARRPGALAEAFLRVPLHAAMFQQFNGHALPPASAIERQIETLGVPPKQKERARQTFTSSQRNTRASYMTGTGRFVQPAVGAVPATDEPPPRLEVSARLAEAVATTASGGLDLDPTVDGPCCRRFPKHRRMDGRGNNGFDGSGRSR